MPTHNICIATDLYDLLANPEFTLGALLAKLRAAVEPGGQHLDSRAAGLAERKLLSAPAWVILRRHCWPAIVAEWSAGGPASVESSGWARRVTTWSSFVEREQSNDRA
ncbi:MAG: hypothetical protein INR71_07830 [Terriglobus roseus]|nr:hypothetical protein [Terriglobus roseus]